MDFRRLFTPGWMLEMERLTGEEAARNLPDRGPRLQVWAVHLRSVGIFVSLLGGVLVMAATPGRYHIDGIAHAYAWYGLGAVFLGLVLVGLALRFGRQRPVTIDDDNP